MKFPHPNQLFREAKSVFVRFPMSMISTLVAMSIMLFLIELDGPKYSEFESLIKIAIVATLGVFMFTALRLLGDKNLLCLIGVVVLVGYYLSLPEDLSQSVISRHIFLSLSFFIMIIWANFWKRDVSNELFWEYTQYILFAFLISIIFTIVVYAGLSGALFSVEKLFALDVDGKRYGQLLFLVMGLFGVTYFLSQIPKSLPHPHTYTKVETIFTKYILTPLSIGYFVILYAYSTKILFIQSFPQGILAWIIIAFSVVAVTTYLFWTPLWSEKAKRYKRFFALALLLQTGMLAVAIWMRVEAYGWTESRYMVAILGLWLAVMSLYFLIFKEARYKWLFITLSAIIMISQLGYFSAYSVSERSQQYRVKTLLEDAKPLSENSPINVRYEISNILDYLARHYGLESVEEIIPEIVKAYRASDESKDAFNFAPFATKKLGFAYIDRWQMAAITRGDVVPFAFYRPQEQYLDIQGYDWIIDIAYNAYNPKEMVQQSIIPSIQTRFVLTPDSLKVEEYNQTISRVNLKAFFKNLHQQKALQTRRYRHSIDEDIKKKLELKYHDNNSTLHFYLYDYAEDINGRVERIYGQLLYKRIAD